MPEKEVRLIDANMLLTELAKGTIITDDLYGMGIMSGVDAARRTIQNMPTISPESLRPKGKWILEAHKESVNYRWNVTAECSNCCDEQKEIWAGFFTNVPDWLARDVAIDSAASVKLSNYCPNCGAKMDLEG